MVGAGWAGGAGSRLICGGLLCCILASIPGRAVAGAPGLGGMLFVWPGPAIGRLISGIAPGFGRGLGGIDCLAAGFPAFHLSGFEGVTALGSKRPVGGPRGGIGRFIGVGGCWREGSGSMVISSGFPPVADTTKSASSNKSPGAN